MLERKALRISVEPAEPDDKHPSVRARTYLVFLCIEGYMKLDWGWALATRMEIGPFLREAGVDLQFDILLGVASRFGYDDGLVLRL